MKKTLFILAILMLLLFSIVSAQTTKSLTLLTVKDQGNDTYVGGTATMVLTLQEGTGAIYIESFPLSEIDTQAATRIATEIACEYTQKNCNNYDFFFTIHADSGLVGGPSGGGATALLTIATLEDLELANVAMTGAISSGGVITPVGGVKEKVLGAEKEQIPIIIIPEFSLNVTNNQTNTSPVLMSDFDEVDARVYAVKTLDEALALATNYKAETLKKVKIPASYSARMQETAQILCTRTVELLEQEVKDNNSLYEQAMNYYNNSLDASDNAHYYSQASFCFSANLRLREIVVQELSQDAKKENYDRLSTSIAVMEGQVNNQTLHTFSDLETFTIVKERLLEAQDYVDDVNTTNISSRDLAYAIERYYSAVAWSRFFGMEGPALLIDEGSLRIACMNEMRQVEGRLNYLRTLIPDFLLDDVNSDLEVAYEHLTTERYALCIFKATKAKAHANVFFSQVDESKLDEFIAVKLNRVYNIISKQPDVFPLLGYSYYEYSAQLMEKQPYSALLFTEYALAMADLRHYFPTKPRYVVNKTVLLPFLTFAAGLLIGYFIAYQKPTRKKKKRR